MTTDSTEVYRPGDKYLGPVEGIRPVVTYCSRCDLRALCRSVRCERDGRQGHILFLCDGCRKGQS
jgi:hypothetical protein